MLINYVRRGEGKPLLLLHGLGNSWRSWQPILAPLAAERAVIAVDLPGFGRSPPLPGGTSMHGLADAIEIFLEEHDLTGADAVGTSIGAWVVLELARRGGVLGNAVSLAPGGFWTNWERRVFQLYMWTAVRVLRSMHAAMPMVLAREWSRRLLMTQCSSNSIALEPSYLLQEFGSLRAATAFDRLLTDLVNLAPPTRCERLQKPLVIGWGRCDCICHPRQAARAQMLFPGARLHWFERCGHYPHWDAPHETARLILETTKD